MKRQENEKRVGVLASLCKGLAEWEAHDRVRHPDRFIGSPDGAGPHFLFAENVAHLLGCNIDLVRRIPRRELPASKVGARLIYQRSDLEAFIRSRRDSGFEPRIVSARKGRAGISGHQVQSAAGKLQEPLDPVAYARSLSAPKVAK
ncbi:helix-turn-helix domain-containing protein [Rhizobium leguminosarum]